jgi:Uma2 family endonuclease
MSTHRPLLRLGKSDDGRLVSSEEFAEADFDEPWRYERVAGRLVVMAPSGEETLDLSEPWRDALIFYKRDHPDIVQRVTSEAWIRVDGGTDRIGDIGVYLVPNGPVGKIPDRVPELMFEFVSEGKKSRDRDYRMKREDYRRFGVREYVVIDRFASTVTVHSLRSDVYVAHSLGVNDVYSSPLLPGLAIPLSEVF